MKNEILSYTHYNRWANQLILDSIETNVRQEDLDRVMISSFPSLRKTIYHIWDAEHIWYKRMNGESLNDWPSKSFSGSFTEAKAGLLFVDQQLIDFVSQLSEHQLQAPLIYKNVEGKTFENPLWQSIHHCMNHSTYHRGQSVTLMRQLGVEKIPSTDFIAWCRTNK